jgi:hypothetical protein
VFKVTCTSIQSRCTAHTDFRSSSPQGNNFKVLFSVLTLVTFPPFFFFTFLYYTDAGSVFFVLLMLLFDLNEHKWLASTFGLISLFFRQNNIIWCFMLAGHFSLRVRLLPLFLAS